MNAVKCKHWSECGVRGGGCCAKNLYGGRPSVGVCLRICQQYDGPARGLGDTVAKITKAVGIKPCDDCEERRKKLNRAVPFRGKKRGCGGCRKKRGR